VSQRHRAVVTLLTFIGLGLTAGEAFAGTITNCP
jgi:hypothetical protein